MNYALPDQIDRDACRRLDDQDSLGPLREQFELPEDVIYLDGNSLGPLPKGVLGGVTDAIGSEWGQGLVRSWNSAGWIEKPLKLGELIAPLLGAASHQVAVADSMSVNLFKLLTAALRLRPDRRVILTDTDNFPSDLYVADSVARLTDAEVVRCAPHEVAEKIDDRTAVLYLTHVNYRSAEIYDMRGLTQRAHDQGALVLWNLAHSAGAVPLELDDCQVDMAVGCGYKYLNGGPGAPAFMYVHDRWLRGLDQPLTGWLGHQSPFEFALDYAPRDGIARTLCGTPPIVAYAALEAALRVFADVDMATVRRKSVAMTSLLIRLVEQHCCDFDVRLVSPREDERRASHVSFAHQNGYAVMQALIDQQIIGDFRAPDLMRFGITPLYLRFVDLWDAVDALATILQTRSWDQPRFLHRAAVT